MAYALKEVRMQFVYQEKYSYTMAFRGRLDGGSVTVRRMRVFLVPNEMVGEACRWQWQLLSPIRQGPSCLV